MTQKERYQAAKEMYAAIGVDTDAAIAKLKTIPVSLHCWQGDDVTGFDHDGPLTGGIQTTGNYPGKARTPEELMADIDMVIKCTPGLKKLNLHASYAIFEDGEFVDRDKIEPKHFAKWVAFAKERNMGIDFNPTFFSHPNVKDGLTLSSPDENVRKFWIEHGKACIRISQYFAQETGIPCVMNIWTGDGSKDIPADRLGPRELYKDSIEQIIAEPHDPKMVKPCVESKVFGIGVESYTVGSAEFALSFAATHEGVLPLMDMDIIIQQKLYLTRFLHYWLSSLRLHYISHVLYVGIQIMLFSSMMRQKKWQKKLYAAMQLTVSIWHWIILMQVLTVSLHGLLVSEAGRKRCYQQCVCLLIH